MSGATRQPASFNPGVDAAGAPCNPTRFAPIRNARGRVVPYLYGGSSRDCAINESVFHSAPIDYLDTARWAEAIHRQFADVDGLLWMSRQRDRDEAVMLFGDRAGKALTGTRMGTALRGNDVLRQAILALVLRVGIDAS